MRLELMQNIGQRQEQRMKLAPRMIQYMEILQLPLMALQNRIEQELQENIALEEDDVRNDFEQTQTSDDSKEDDFETDDAVSEDFDRIYEQFQDLVEAGQRPSGNRLDSESDRKHDAMQNMISRPRSFFSTVQTSFTNLQYISLNILTMTVISRKKRWTILSAHLGNPSVPEILKQRFRLSRNWIRQEWVPEI